MSVTKSHSPALAHGVDQSRRRRADERLIRTDRLRGEAAAHDAAALHVHRFVVVDHRRHRRRVGPRAVAGTEERLVRCNVADVRIARDAPQPASAIPRSRLRAVVPVDRRVLAHPRERLERIAVERRAQQLNVVARRMSRHRVSRSKNGFDRDSRCGPPSLQCRSKTRYLSRPISVVHRRHRAFIDGRRVFVSRCRRDLSGGVRSRQSSASGVRVAARERSAALRRVRGFQTVLGGDEARRHHRSGASTGTVRERAAADRRTRGDQSRSARRADRADLRTVEGFAEAAAGARGIRARAD